MTMRCIAVDDEPLALDLIESYIAKAPQLVLAARCGTALEALPLIRAGEADLLLLDIQLPDLSGFELLATIPNPPYVIFTTAYDRYAVQSYTVSAVDYLLKPFSFQRFLQAVSKVPAAEAQSRHVSPEISPHIFIHTDSRTVRVAVDDIHIVQGMNDYVLIKTRQTRYTVRDSMRDIENALSRYGFMRIHKSYIVAVDKISSIEHNVIRVRDETIPIGKFYRDAFLAFINARKIG
jgi:two-component system, LytTR family, response regulator